LLKIAKSLLLETTGRGCVIICTLLLPEKENKSMIRATGPGLFRIDK
jgi:hypothetical protein